MCHEYLSAREEYGRRCTIQTTVDVEVHESGRFVRLIFRCMDYGFSDGCTCEW
jgi:hypothetical protein